MNTRVVEPNGAQVLPPVDDQRATIPAWVGHLLCDADERTKYAAYTSLASELVVTS